MLARDDQSSVRLYFTSIIAAKRDSQEKLDCYKEKR